MSDQPQKSQSHQRDGYLYAKSGGGFVRLMADGSTSKAGGRLRLDFMSYDKAPCRDALGRLCTPEVKGAAKLEPAKQQLLLGGGQ